MQQTLFWIAIVFIGVLLFVGAYTDYKRHEIPNFIPIGIFLCGFMINPHNLLVKFLHLILLVIALLIAAAATKKPSGGGDIKTYAALTFVFNLFSLGIILFFTIVLRLIVQIARGEKGKGINFPMCCYLAPAYLLYISLSQLF